MLLYVEVFVLAKRAEDFASTLATSVSGARVPGQAHRARGCSEMQAGQGLPRAVGGAGRGPGGGTGGVTWRGCRRSRSSSAGDGRLARQGVPGARTAGDCARDPGAGTCGRGTALSLIHI